MRDGVGIACAFSILVCLGAGCGPGLEPPGESADRDVGGGPTAGEDDTNRPDAGPGDDGLDAGAENDHTNGDDPGD